MTSLARLRFTFEDSVNFSFLRYSAIAHRDFAVIIFSTHTHVATSVKREDRKLTMFVTWKKKRSHSVPRAQVAKVTQRPVCSHWRFQHLLGPQADIDREAPT